MKKAGLVVFIAAVLLIFIWLIWSSSEWKSERVIENLELKGISFLTEQELIGNNRKDYLANKHDSLSLLEIEQSVKKHKYVDDAQAFVDGDKLIIDVVEKFPAAYLINDSKVQYVDKDFHVLPFRFIKGYTDLPVIRVSSEWELKQRRDDIALLIESLTNENGTLINKMISEVYHGERVIEIVLNQNGVRVLVDKNSDLDIQIKKFNIFWNNYLSGNITEEFRKIDLRWENRIVVL